MLIAGARRCGRTSREAGSGRRVVYAARDPPDLGGTPVTRPPRVEIVYAQDIPRLDRSASRLRNAFAIRW